MFIPSCTDVAWVSTCGSSDVEGLVCTELVLAVYMSVCVVVREDSVCLPLTWIPAALGTLVLGQGKCQFFISLDKILIRMEMSHLAVFPLFSSISLLPVLSYRR